MISVYVVIGSQGEYSDRTEWASMVFVSKANAERYCEQREALVRQALIEGAPEIQFTSIDPHLIKSYGEASYRVETALLGDIRYSKVWTGGMFI